MKYVLITIAELILGLVYLIIAGIPAGFSVLWNFDVHAAGRLRRKIGETLYINQLMTYLNNKM